MLLLLACTGTTAETPARMLTPTEFQNATRDLIGLPYEGLEPRYDDDEDGQYVGAVHSFGDSIGIQCFCSLPRSSPPLRWLGEP